jgi:hypothetical protein
MAPSAFQPDREGQKASGTFSLTWHPDLDRAQALPAQPCTVRPDLVARWSGSRLPCPPSTKVMCDLTPFRGEHARHQYRAGRGLRVSDASYDERQVRVVMTAKIGYNSQKAFETGGQKGGAGGPGRPKIPNEPKTRGIAGFSAQISANQPERRGRSWSAGRGERALTAR